MKKIKPQNEHETHTLIKARHPLEYHDNSELRASILTKIGSVGKGCDRLQLIKFWPSSASGKGVWGGANFFGSTLLQPARSVCISLSAFFNFNVRIYKHAVRIY